MSDIDFEELDKAVNSLVGGDSTDKKEPATQASSDDSTPQDTAPKVGPALASRRSSGRFMDMKHDSSDMQKKDNSLLGGTAKTNITPLNPDVVAEDSPSKKSDTEPAQKSDWPDPIDTKKDDESIKEPSSTDMPDPLDHIVTNDTKKDDLDDHDAKPDKEAEHEEVSKDKPEIDYEETDEKKDDKKESPFLDDAKVEKRPLGGFSDESPVTPSSSGDAKDGKDSTDEEKPQPPTEPVELPPELDKDLVAIEAGEALEVQNPSPEEDEGTSEKDQEKDVSDKDKNKKSDQKEKVSELLASAATGSIPDQYKRENRSHELHAPHPLFDDDHYKGDLKNAAPKPPKSLVARIFQWILIGVGVLLLGGFLGASFFVFASGQ